jgi:hypothetical protein
MMVELKAALQEKITVHGNVLIETHDVRTGKLITSEVRQNHVPLVGRTLIGSVLIGDTALTGQPPSHVAIGTGTSGVADTDTQLGNEVYRNVITQKIVNAGTVTWKFFVPSVTANGYNLSEACIFNSSQLVPVMPILSRVTHTPIAKTANISVTYTWVHTFSQST